VGFEIDLARNASKAPLLRWELVRSIVAADSRYNRAMRRWELTIVLDPAREQPLFLQLAGAIADDIRRGRLKPGDALPGSRELAERLGVNRNTVVAGYGELAAEGLISTRIGGGTFVADSAIVPLAPHAPSGKYPTCPTYPLAPPMYRLPQISKPTPGALNICNGMPDVRLFPAAAMARAFRRAIGQRGRALLTYAVPCGHPRLRKELAAMLACTRALPVTPDNLMITRSIEQAIDLVARMLLRPGDVVVVEAFGYPPAWSVLKLAGARLMPLPLDEDGLDVGALETLLAQQQVRAVFLTPHHQFPTTVVMSHAKRTRLAELAWRHGFAIIEDDYDHEFHYAGKPVLPIASGAGRANVIYIGSLSNLLAPGISSGFVIAPAPVFERLASLRAASDAQGDAAMECAIAELFEDGELLRHVRRMRRIYAARRDALAASLVRHLGSAVTFRIPAGGTGLWLRVDDAIDVATWSVAGEREGVQFFDAGRYEFFQREQPFMRLGFSYHDETELDEAVRRMARALTQLRGSTVRSVRKAIVQTTQAASHG
jgi:GntR family transcriptional regulator / MocR family aminotransferase